MAYLGNVPARSFISFERQVFTIVNSQTAYTLSHSVTNENDIRLVINNVVQEPGSGKAYTASGTTLTLSAALTNGTDEMYCVFLGRAVGTVNAPAGSVAASQLAADSVTAAKLNDDIISGQTALASEPADTDEFLVSDAGTLKRIDYSLIKSGLTLIKTQTASGAASVEFNNGTSDVVIDSTYSHYKIVGFNITPQNNDVNIFIQFSTDAGSSYASSGYYTMIHRNTDGTFRTDLNSTGSALNMNNVGNNTNEEGAFEFTVFNPSSSSHFKHYHSLGTTRNADAAVQFFESGGIYEATTAVDGFKIGFSSGNISGTFKLYGIT